jgi:uncharacterized membrane protein
VISPVHERSKRSRSPLAGPYGHPFHAILVTVPIGAWIAALVFDLVAIFGGDTETFAQGAALLTGIGLVGAVVAAAIGFFDFSQLERGTKVHRVALIHMALNLTAIALFSISLLVRAMVGFDELSGIAVTLGVIGLIGLGVSGYLGGEMAYRYGVRVADERTQEGGFAASRRP